jgi:crotonyl-CoA carboxylase/reductase
MVDLRYHRTRQRLLQGFHGTNDVQAYGYNQLVYDGKVDPCLGRVAAFADIPLAHAKMVRGEGVRQRIWPHRRR